MMTYTLKTIDENLKERILNEIKISNEGRYKMAIRFGFFEEKDKSIAINEENNSFIFSVPPITRPDTMEFTYYFFYQNEFYQLRPEDVPRPNKKITITPFTSLENIPLSAQEISPKLKECIRAAFLAYGLFGCGSAAGIFDNLIPEFEECA